MRRTAGWAISPSTMRGASAGAWLMMLTFEHHGIAAGQRQGECAHAQDHRPVPRDQPQHHADRLAHRHDKAARPVDGHDLAADLGRHRRGFAHHAGGKIHVEPGPGDGAAGLRHHGGSEILAARLQPVGRAHQDRAALRRADGRPGWKGCLGCLNRGLGILTRCRSRARRQPIGHRIQALEGSAVGSGPAFIVDEKVSVHGKPRAKEHAGGRPGERYRPSARPWRHRHRPSWSSCRRDAG